MEQNKNKLDWQESNTAEFAYPEGATVVWSMN